MKLSRVLSVIILLLALVMAVGHMPLALGFSALFRPPGPPPQLPPRPPQAQNFTRPAFPFFAIGGYFLFATIVYIAGGILVFSRRLFKLANISLIVLAAIDNILLIYTRTSDNIFFGRPSPWSTSWFPVGTVQILIGQTILIALCATLLYKR